MKLYTSIPYGRPQSPGKFRDKIIAVTRRLNNNSQFNQAVVGLRRKWSIPDVGFRNDNEWGSWDYPMVDSHPNYVEDNYKNVIDGDIKVVTSKEGLRHIVDISGPWRRDLNKIVEDFKIDRSFYLLVQWYIFQNRWREEFYPQRNFDVFFEPESWSKDENIIPRLFVEIYPSTTINDIVGNWRDIKGKQKILAEGVRFIKDRPKIERDSEILHLQNAGKKPSEIVEIIEAKYGDIIGEDETGAIVQRSKRRFSSLNRKS